MLTTVHLSTLSSLRQQPHPSALDMQGSYNPSALDLYRLTPKLYRQIGVAASGAGLPSSLGGFRGLRRSSFLFAGLEMDSCRDYGIFLWFTCPCSYMACT